MKKLFAFKNLIILLLLFSLTLFACENPNNSVEHKHSLVFNKGKEATCLEEGVIDSYSCSTCGKIFKDENASFELLSLVLNTSFHSYKNGVCTVCDIEELNKDAFTRIDINGVPTQNGNYLLFGSYPQTDVTIYMAEELSSYVSNLPNNENRNGFKNYNYNDSTVWYKDVIHTDSEQYRAVYIESYRKNKYNDDGSSQKDNGYYLNEIYWFKFEPIKWRILSENNNEAFILSELILDSQEFQANCVFADDPTSSWGGIYVSDGLGNIKIDDYNVRVDANNYEYSSIRSWLNYTFYHTAFNSFQKELIKLTLVENGANTTASPANGFLSNDTNDNIFLPCYKDIVNDSYGFNKNDTVNDVARQKQCSDYSKIQGINVNNSCGDWWTRSSKPGYGYYVQLIGKQGTACEGYFIYLSNVGVVPALKVKLS